MEMEEVILLNNPKLEITISRLGYQLIENHYPFKDTVVLGLQPRGKFLAMKICSFLEKEIPECQINLGFLDATFHRDDIHLASQILIPSQQKIDFSIENKKVVLIDDVLYTGRTIRAGLESMLDFGRPSAVELLVLVDRRYSRELPLEADYVGISVDTRTGQRVKVDWDNDIVYLKNNHPSNHNLNHFNK